MFTSNGERWRSFAVLVAAPLFVVVALLGLPHTVAASTAEEIAAALAKQLSGDAAKPDETAAVLRDVYAENGFAPLWLDGDGLTAKGRALQSVLEDAETEGLAPERYATAATAILSGAGDAERLARLEIALSRALLRYAADLSHGRVDPNKIDPDVFAPQRGGDPRRLLTEARRASDIAAYLSTYAPQAPEYARLKQALADYRELARRGGWIDFPKGETLKPGMRDPRVPLLRERLKQLGDLPPTRESAEQRGDALLYDEALQTAVKRFQYRHGLDQDAAVGRKTTAALNVPVEQRIEQMVLNLERRRWMAAERSDFYVFVNMADFALKVVDGERTIFASRVVVGTAYNQTPVFNGTMTYIELNPFWNIPPSIARKEMLPKIRQDVSYLERENIRVFSGWGEDASELDPRSIDWAGVSSSAFPYKLRQDPGPDNALGRIKFMFPNRFNVYLHDTPARALFRRSVRSFSHGCIRVERPLDLGRLLLSRNGDWTRDRLESKIATGRRQVITLEKPVSVYLTYLTAWVNKDGTVHFRDDIYGRDKTLAKALHLSHLAMAQ